MLNANQDRIVQEITDVATRHTNDMDFLTKERLDALTANLKERDEKAAKLQGAVDKALKEYTVANNGRVAQQAVRDAARKTLDGKQGVLDAQKAVQSSNLTMETDIKTQADDATLSAFNNFMADINTEERRANSIIAREQGILAEIRSILSGDLATDAAAHSKVNTCATEEAAQAQAATAAGKSGDECD